MKRSLRAASSACLSTRGRTLLAAAAMAGCTAADSPTAPAAAAAPTASQRAAAAGNGNGAVVERFRVVDFGFLSILDAERGLGITVGLITPIAELCATGALAASENVVQFVTTPSGNERFLVRGREAPIVVYDYTGGAPSLDPCELVGRPVVATGTGAFTASQSGFTAVQYAASAHGTLTLVGGGGARLTGTEHYRTPRDGSAPVLRSVVRLTPVGAR